MQNHSFRLGFPVAVESHLMHRVPAQPLRASGPCPEGQHLCPSLALLNLLPPGESTSLPQNPLPFQGICFPSRKSSSLPWNPHPFHGIHFPSMESTFLPWNPHPFHGILIPSRESTSLPGNLPPFSSQMSVWSSLSGAQRKGSHAGS